MEARRRLKDEMVQEPRRAKECLVEAAHLFVSLRTAHALTHFDPLAFLYAGLYIWVYIVLAVPRQGQDSIHTSPSGGDVLRLDLPRDSVLHEGWLLGRDSPALFITGIGVLGAERSLVRLQKEAARVFASSARSSRLAAGLASAMTAAASGKPLGWDAVETERGGD